MRSHKKVHIVGGGITGSFLSYFLSNYFNVFLYEKDDDLGGLCKTYTSLEGYSYLKGAHILHTNEKWIIDVIKNTGVNLFPVEYNVGIHPLFDFRYYSFPFDYQSISTMPWHWKESILQDLEKANGKNASNLKDLIINFYGENIYHQIFDGFIRKMLGEDASLIEDFSYFRNLLRTIEKEKTAFYYTDSTWFPINEGWNHLFFELTKNINIYTSQEVNYRDFKSDDIIIITGMSDHFFEEDLSLFSKSSFDIDSSQYDSGKPDTLFFPNYTDYFSMTQFGKFFYQDKNIIVKEYPYGEEYTYPIYTRKNINSWDNFCKSISKNYPNVYFAGRFGSFKFFDMVDCIKQASRISSEIIHQWRSS